MAIRSIDFGSGCSVNYSSAHSTDSFTAPQEVYRSSKEPLKGSTELTKSDRNRRRRQIKMMKRSQQQQRDLRVKTEAALDTRKRTALEKHQALKTLEKSRNVTLMPQMKKHLASSNSKSKRGV